MKHIVILGGGFAGINLLNGLKKELGHSIGKKVKVTLVDKNSFHFRKVLLFKAIAEDTNLKIPLNYLIPLLIVHFYPLLADVFTPVVGNCQNRSKK